MVENHLGIDEVSLIMLNQLDYVQVASQLFLAFLEQFMVFLGHLISFRAVLFDASLSTAYKHFACPMQVPIRPLVLKILPIEDQIEEKV